MSAFIVKTKVRLPLQNIAEGVTIVTVAMTTVTMFTWAIDVMLALWFYSVPLIPLYKPIIL